MGAIRQHEKDMIIGYENPEAVAAAHAKWLQSQDKAKKIASQFLEGEEDVDNPVVRDIIKRLDSYRDLFSNVARQLKASGYDTATVANGMSAKAVARFAEADELMTELDRLLREEVTKSVARARSGICSNALVVCAGGVDDGRCGGAHHDHEHELDSPPLGGRPQDSAGDCWG